MQAWLDLHRHQLLHEQFTSVGNPNLTDVLSGIAPPTIKLAFIKIGFTEQTALMTHVHTVTIGNIKQSLLQEPRTSMGHHAVALHLTEAETTVTRPAFSRLTGQNLSGSTTPRVNLVADHMLEPLVVGRSQEDHHLQLLACESVVHHLVSVLLIA